ncbi:hypothetical protein [Sphingomicrobium astaxanthinifaciens]|uniref:hypothetical protein n=1 Tax=Sphingomicrobium astaxanthinifaciens TaxID=1227949 RepID=UPI001FCA7D21|nr:hypothetical protein [Sphingomicrobium astaxanthinifaciens]MCJ7421499.1 hypothetical protein [Sphingomicrobium astaxanthinifaciens]
MSEGPPPVWQVRSAYLPLLFLALVLPWGAFALVAITMAWPLVEPLFYFYLVVAGAVFLIGVRLIREKQTPGLFRAATALALVAALPALLFVGWMVATSPTPGEQARELVGADG